jgi:hypothetical protein
MANVWQKSLLAVMSTELLCSIHPQSAAVQGSSWPSTPLFAEGLELSH